MASTPAMEAERLNERLTRENNRLVALNNSLKAGHRLEIRRLKAELEIEKLEFKAGMVEGGQTNRACHFKAPNECWEKGFFHEWSTDHEEFECGPGPLPVAIIEDEHGQVHSIHVNRVKFGD